MEEVKCEAEEFAFVVKELDEFLELADEESSLKIRYLVARDILRQQDKDLVKLS